MLPSPELSLKDLAQQDAHAALEVVRFIEGELAAEGQSSLRGARVLVAMSGGADSTALLVLFCALRGYLGLDVHAAHLDHGLREESAAEAEAVRRLCSSFGVPVRIRREDVAALAQTWHCGIEEAGRRVRYEFLEQCRLDAGASWVLTAHHAGDLAEDVLMRLTRGAAWPGLGGMRAVTVDANRRVLRPLLMREKGELMGLLERLGIAWQEDLSNQSREWKRNRMRLDVMPLLMAENPSFLDGIRRMWRSAREDERWWTAHISETLVLSGTGESFRISICAEAMDSLGRAGRLRAMAEAVRRMERGQPRADTLKAVDDAWQARRFPRRFSFAGGLKVEVSAKGAVFFLAPGR